VDANRVFGRTDVVDMVRLREEMDRRLAVKEEEVGADGTTRHRRVRRRSGILSEERSVSIVIVDLGEDEDTVVCTGHRCIIGLRGDSMNLLGRFFGRAYCRNMALFAAILTDDCWCFVLTGYRAR
jgi:hypothetical protein